jgi:hypothetical protein
MIGEGIGADVQKVVAPQVQMGLVVFDVGSVCVLVCVSFDPFWLLCPIASIVRLAWTG